MRFSIALLLFVSSLNAMAANPLDRVIRPQLPAEIRTVGDAANWYAEVAGYKFLARTAGGGDARKIAYQPAPVIHANAGNTTVQSALLALVPADVELLVDQRAGVVSFRVHGSEQ